MTRGHIRFFIQDSQDQEAEQILAIGLSHDAYPSYYGEKLYEGLKDAMVTPEISVERAFLRKFGNWDSDYLMDDEYIYTVVMKPFLAEKEYFDLAEISHFEVETGYDTRNIIFAGNAEAFKAFCSDEE